MSGVGHDVLGTSEWLLLRTDRSEDVPPLFHPLLEEWRDIAELEQRLGIADGTPILVAPDGTIDPRLTRYFSSPTFQSLSPDSQDSYSKDMRLWLAYLTSRGIDWPDATAEDVLRYKVFRRRRDLNPRAVSVSRWARERAAMLKFYKWASAPARGYVRTNPVLEVDDDARVVESSSSKGSARTKWATPRTYRLWRDIGLLGYDLDGRRAPGWRGRNELRNRAYVDFLFGSALRNKEGSTLLTIELPDRADEGRLHSGRVARATAKRRERSFYVLDDSLRRVDEYRRTTRASAVRSAERRGLYEASSWLRVTEVRRSQAGTKLYFSGRWSDVSDIDLRERKRLLFVDKESGSAEPLWLWLREDGLPFDRLSWDGVFNAANERVERVLSGAGRQTVVLTAHSLRHSFALYMLVTLHRAIDRRAGRAMTTGDYDEDRYRVAWDIVRDLLGHASTDFTKEKYLEPVNGIRLQELLSEGDDLDEVLRRLAVRDNRISDLVD